MENYVDALTRCRNPHQVILSIQDALIARHIHRDVSSDKGVSLGVSFGEIDRNTCDSIEEVIENARKTTKVLARQDSEADELDARSDGSSERGGWGPSLC